MNAVTGADTVAGYLSSIKRLHELGGFPFPAQTHLLKLQMMAIRRELAHLVKKAPPIAPEILLDIYQVMDKQSEQELVAYAALVVGFTLFLRKSNLVPETVGTFNVKEQITVDDVWFNGKTAVVGDKVEQRHSRTEKETCCFLWYRQRTKKFVLFTG